jgi:3',5'-cyclic AMP phosphodiesterase CpdA
MYTLAHFSDPHLPPLPTPRFSELASKRMLGFLNWQRKRRDIHHRGTLDEIVADMVAQAPDHIALTGDVVNISLPDEFDVARAWLAALGSPQNVTLVPGNHDAYVRSMAGQAASAWGAYMCGDEGTEAGFPFVRRRPGLALVGVSTAFPSPPIMATGRVGARQIARLAELLSALRAERVFRIVLIHHPPEIEPGRRHERLIDAEAFRNVLAKTGAELVLHGHDHVNSVSWLDGPDRRVPVVCVPSASAAVGGRWEPAGYNLYRIEGEPRAWRCEMVARGFRPDNNGIGELGRRVLMRIA